MNKLYNSTDMTLGKQRSITRPFCVFNNKTQKYILTSDTKVRIRFFSDLFADRYMKVFGDILGLESSRDYQIVQCDYEKLLDEQKTK